MPRRTRVDAPLPYAPFGKILREEGAYRVSRGAVEELHDIAEKLSREIAREAVELARHAGRRTIEREDIDLAVKRLFKATPVI